METDSLSIVIPAYNESHNLPGVVQHCWRMFREHRWTGEILVCDDGSHDATLDVLRDMHGEVPILRVLTHPTNRGVGEALRTLYGSATSAHVCFLPADGQVAADQVPALLAGLERFDVVIGQRVLRQDPPWRRWSASLYNASLRLLFGLAVHDVDSVTLFRREALEVDALTSRGIVMCAELLLRARKQGYRIGEVPVEHHPRHHGVQTGARPRFILTAMRELVLLRLRLWKGSPGT